jgi:transcriptional regulator with XRE-family HTH domain
MRLNEFGKKARLLRMEHDLSLKEMADGMDISSAHLSALEYGDKKLNETHIDAAVKFFRNSGIGKIDLDALREAGAKSIESVSTKEMPADARAMVYAFARKLQGGDPPSAAITAYLKKTSK